MLELYQRQIQLETEAVERGRQRYLNACVTRHGNRKGTKDQPVGHAIIRTLVHPVAEALGDSLEITRGSAKVKRIREDIKGLELSHLEIAYLGIRTLLERDLLQDQGGVPVTSLGVALGRAMVAEAQLREFHAAHKYYVEKTIENHALLQSNPQAIIKAIARGKERIMGETELDQHLSNLDAFAMGNEVIKIILTVCADWFVRTPGKSKHVPAKVVATSKLLAWIQDREEVASLLRPVLRPMVAPPKDWSSDSDGGYLTIPNRIILSKNPVHRHRTEPSAQARRALNAAQRTAWRVNRRVYQVAVQLYGQGTGEAGLTPVVEIPDDLPEGASAEARKERRMEQLAAYQESIRTTSGRTAERLKLDTAQEYLEEEAFYFPCAFDWRGRVYPLPTMLNPQGDDLAKGLLEFSKGKPLGPEGVRWLAIHGANVWGEDKAPYHERLEWVKKNEGQIVASAEDPFENRWWTEADSPFKFLAFCFEWLEVLSEDYPEAYISHLPVALDGTCSGLQHFSALLRDPRGGASVNLVPAAKPADIYSEVAQEVQGRIKGDSWQSRCWEGLINRTTCKRGTMTQPYGVTRHGLGDQLLDLLKTEPGYEIVFERAKFERAKVNDRMSDEDWEAYDDKPSATRACLWLSELLEEAIGEVVVASQEGKRFLNELASCYSAAGLDFTWVTPAGMKITQGYRAPKMARVNTFYGGTRVRLNIADDTGEVPKNARKARAGSSPNVIHSLDATHLLWTVLDCYDRAGIRDFALIHDSFGVHACHIPTLNQSLRSTFVGLYSQPILEDLLMAALRDLPEEIHGDLPRLPEKGSLDLEVVRLSPYCFM